MIKKFQIELLLLGILILNIFIYYEIDIGFYNFFKNFNNSLQNIYLKEFFQEITVIGDSKWYFILSLLSIAVCHLIIKYNYFNKCKNTIKVFKNFGLYLFLSLICTGLLTQLLKHVIGRPRPNHASFDDAFEFKFFSLNSEFHSFPSGHTSTIFAVALVVIFFIPKLKYFLLLLAGIVAFSRVVIGVHFFTDVLGGIVISYLGVKIIKLLLDKHYPIKTFEKFELFFDYKISFSFIIFFFIVIVFAVGSSIDIYFSNIFYYGNGQFWLQNNDGLTIFFRKIILRLILVYTLILPILTMLFPLKQFYFNYRFKIKDIVFIWCANIFGLLIIINLFFKNIWGRARPVDIFQLGGKENFTPWHQISDACSTNCSFVSGDAAVGFSLIILYFLIKKEIYFWLSLFFGFSIGMIRVLEGGHFISDIVIAGFIIFITYCLLLKFYKKYV